MTGDFLTSQGAVFSQGRVMSFGNEAAEYQALESAIVVPLLGHTALRVTGEDRLDFIQGQVSNQVKRLKVNTFSENLMLNHKGHALAQLRVFRREDDLFLAIEGGAGGFAQRELRAHIIFDQVELQNLSETLVSFTVQGANAAKIISSLATLPLGDSFIQVPFANAKVLIHLAKRSVWGGFDIHVLSSDAEAFLQTLLNAGAILAGEKALEVSRIAASIPYAQTEAGEGILPQEAGLEHCISYTKGCYLGQEIMARIEARGNMRRRLTGLKLSGIPRALDRNILAGEKIVGQLGAWARHPTLGVIALAVLRNDLDPDLILNVSGLEAKISVIDS
jgi:tRNA-modifying protein YgfZ